MEYVYAALLLHKAGQKVEEESVKKVLTAAGVQADDGRIRSLIAALDGVDIEEAIKSAAIAPVASATAAPAAEEKKEEKKEEEKKDDSAAAAGLGALFG
ncbi:50S ribosomal protein P1 [Candidatus Woesearchaeota archaeon]|nr:50S ribosomal protein P1 [Candidatus Woesearchaeota archaeon]MCF7900873.1 50S ribosomal protein P1 [Candidatus Woesearchaeota archaeon]MCF8013888.1 50S ribosomal protein P1 [Candidatus Woesearchaeota archaeon]